MVGKEIQSLVLKSEGLVPPHVFGKPHRDKVKPDPKKPHEDWMVDITYIPIQSVDWYLIVLLDVYWSPRTRGLHSRLGVVIQHDMA